MAVLLGLFLAFRVGDVTFGGVSCCLNDDILFARPEQVESDIEDEV